MLQGSVQQHRAVGNTAADHRLLATTPHNTHSHKHTHNNTNREEKRQRRNQEKHRQGKESHSLVSMDTQTSSEQFLVRVAQQRGSCHPLNNSSGRSLSSEPAALTNFFPPLTFTAAVGCFSNSSFILQTVWHRKQRKTGSGTL